jgi:hypothetical protein
MKANRRMLDLSRPLNIIASGTGTTVFRGTLGWSTRSESAEYDAQSAEGSSCAKRRFIPFILTSREDAVSGLGG